jgi:hypothetical protein
VPLSIRVGAGAGGAMLDKGTNSNGAIFSNGAKRSSHTETASGCRGV